MSKAELVITPLEAPDLQEAASYEETQRQGFLARAYMAGQNALNGAVGSVMHSRAARYGVAGAAALGVSMGVAGMAEGAAAAGAKKAHGCERVVKNVVSFSSASKAVLPFASEVINADRHADQSEVEIKRNQAELYGTSGRHLTEVDINVPVNSGVYTYAAQFSGKDEITAKNLVLTSMTSYKYKQVGVARVDKLVYGFVLEKTRGHIFDPNEGLHWDMEHDYVNGSNRGDWITSKLPNNSEVGGTYGMTASILSAGLRQAEGVLEDMTEHRDATEQKNLNAAKPPIKVCG